MTAPERALPSDSAPYGTVSLGSYDAGYKKALQEAKDAAAGLVAALDEYVKTGTSSRRMIAAHQTRHDAVAAIAAWNKWVNGGE